MTDSEAVLEALSAPERNFLQRVLTRTAVQPWTQGLPRDAILKATCLPREHEQATEVLAKFVSLGIMKGDETGLALTERGMQVAVRVQKLLREAPREILLPKKGLPLDYSAPLLSEIDWVKSFEKAVGKLDRGVKAKLAAAIEDICAAPNKKGKEWKYGLKNTREIHVDNNFTLTWLVRGKKAVLLAIAHHDDIAAANRKASVEARNEGLD